MACGNNNNRGGNLGGLKNILDFNVTYTGCETSCGGREIKTGDSLRNVLDALVANCDGGSGPSTASTNFWFSRNVPTFTVDVKDGDFALTGAGAIYEFVGGEWQNTGIQIGGGGDGESVWGQITGEIADQTDLTEYINLLITEAPLSIDKFGENFHKKDGDEKIHLGGQSAELDGGGLDYLLVSKGDFSFPRSTEGSSLLMANGDESSGLLFANISSSGNVSLESKKTVSATADNNVLLTSNGGAVTQRVPDAAIVLGGQFPPGLQRGIFIDGNHIFISDGGGSSFLRLSNSEVRLSGVLGLVGTGADRKLVLGADSGTNRGGFIIRTPQGGGTNNEVIVGSYNFVTDEYGEIGFKYGVEPSLTNDLDIPHKKYVDDSVAALQNTIDAQATQIADLTARIEALENA